MVSTNRLFKLALNVNDCSVIGARIEPGKNRFSKIIVEVKPYKRVSNRCPVCGKKSIFDGYFFMLKTHHKTLSQQH